MSELEKLLSEGDQCLPPKVRKRLEDVHSIACALAAVTEPKQPVPVWGRPPACAGPPAPQIRRAKPDLPDISRKAIRRVAAARLHIARHASALASGLRQFSRKKPPPPPTRELLFTEIHIGGGRSLTSSLASILVHAGIVLLILTVGPGVVRRAARVHGPLVWLAPTQPQTPPAPPKIREFKPRPRLAPPDPEAIARLRLPVRPPVEKPLITPPEVHIVPPKIETPPSITHAPPPPPPPKVQTGAFQQLTASVEAQTSPASVRRAGFDQAAKITVPQAAAGEAARAGFAQVEAAAVSAPTGTLQTGRFSAGDGGAARPAGMTGGASRTGMFGSAASAAPPDSSKTTGAPARTSFDRAAAAARVPEVETRPAPKPKTQPVEIVDKPKPKYTNAATEAKIEGVVSLEVVFTARGQVQVRRVVKGLGYGLDEAAVEAASRIRFNPASVNGSPVDQIAVVQVAFQLSR